MRTIMIFYAIAFSSFLKKGFKSLCTIICYIYLQIFPTEFFDDSIHSIRCASAQGVLQHIYTQ
jgi:hypothetical protein